MRKLIGIPFLALLACQGSGTDGTTVHQQSLVCSGADVPIYRNRFAPQAGASGVATAPEAAAGVISSDAPSGGTAGPVATSGAASTVPASGSPSTAATTDTGTAAGTDAGGGDDAFTAMIATCGAAPCSPDQVAVDAPPMVSTTTGVAGPAVTAAVAAPSSAPAAAAATTTSDTAAAPAPPSTPTSNLVCTSPPPTCPQGQSPQFTTKQTWECTDCSLVVTYGGIYGNYRRCVNVPHLECPDGEVPTWVYEDEQWECQPKCNNGQYDQHTVQGVLVCVPC